MFHSPALELEKKLQSFPHCRLKTTTTNEPWSTPRALQPHSNQSPGLPSRLFPPSHPIQLSVDRIRAPIMSMAEARPPKRTMDSENSEPALSADERLKQLKNKERAFIAASRRSDRSLAKRLKSAHQASEVHREITGRRLKISEEVVKSDAMYEEEEDERTKRSQAHRLLSLQLPGYDSDLHPVDEEFARAFNLGLRRHSVNHPLYPSPAYRPQHHGVASMEPRTHFRSLSTSFEHYQSSQMPYMVQAPQAAPQISEDRPTKYRRMSSASISQTPSPSMSLRPPYATSDRSSSTTSSIATRPGSTPLTSCSDESSCQSRGSLSENTLVDPCLTASPDTEPDAICPSTPPQSFVTGNSILSFNPANMTVCVDSDYTLVDQRNCDPNMMGFQYPAPQYDQPADLGFTMSTSEAQAFEPMMASDELINYADWVDCEGGPK